jgi:hypothetical protein
MGCVSRLAAPAVVVALALAPGVAMAWSGYPGVLENDVAPAIGGDVSVGGTAVASPGEWSGEAPIAFAYQWESCPAGACAPIPGATAATYAPGPADQGARLAVAVTASNAATTFTATSALSAPVAPPVAQVQASLLGQLVPRDRTLAVAIGVQTRRGYRLAFDAPVAGRLTVDWYQGRHSQVAPGAAGPTLVAKGSATLRQPGPNAVQIRTTARGRTLVKRSRRLALTAVAAITPAQSAAVSALAIFTLQ